MKTRLTNISMLVLAMALPTAMAVAEQSATPKVKPEIVPDKELLATIEALPDNTWLKLPPCKTTGDMGVLSKDPDYKRAGPRVRDYCNRMVWAPERNRALYCGGGHNIHPWNDVWEFDLLWRRTFPLARPPLRRLFSWRRRSHTPKPRPTALLPNRPSVQGSSRP